MAPGSAEKRHWLERSPPILFRFGRGKPALAEPIRDDLSGTGHPPAGDHNPRPDASEDLKLERLWVVYPGKAAYRLTEKIQVISLADVRDTWNYG
ncbi:MAG: hypothetical protein ABII68_10205 [Pseudomonadota bacterium]